METKYWRKSAPIQNESRYFPCTRRKLYVVSLLLRILGNNHLYSFKELNFPYPVKDVAFLKSRLVVISDHSFHLVDVTQLAPSFFNAVCC